MTTPCDSSTSDMKLSLDNSVPTPTNGPQSADLAKSCEVHNNFFTQGELETMSAESTEAVFVALILANIPPRSWSAQAFTDHVKEATPLSVSDYMHTIDAHGVVTLTFVVDHNGTTANFAGKFKKGTVNEVDRNGVPQPKPTFDGPVDAGTGGFNADNIKTQIWYRFEEKPNTLREFRFETAINFPRPLPLVP